MIKKLAKLQKIHKQKSATNFWWLTALFEATLLRHYLFFGTLTLYIFSFFGHSKPIKNTSFYKVYLTGIPKMRVHIPLVFLLSITASYSDCLHTRTAPLVLLSAS